MSCEFFPKNCQQYYASPILCHSPPCSINAMISTTKFSTNKPFERPSAALACSVLENIANHSRSSVFDFAIS